MVEMLGKKGKNWTPSDFDIFAFKGQTRGFEQEIRI